MAVADELFNKLGAIDAKLTDIMAAHDDEDDEDARKDEEEAKKHDEDAKRHEEDAARARDDDDEEDAKRHDEEAKKKRDEAAKRRADAMKKHEESANRRREAGDEESAKRHEEEAKRLKDEDARKHDEEEARKHDEEDAKKHDDGDEDDMAKMMGMFLRAMGYAKKMEGGYDEDDEEAYGKHIKRLVKLMGMSYPGASPSAKKKMAAKHDDVAEDTKLFKKLIQQYRGDDTSMDAAREKRETSRRLRRMEASLGMLTDTVSKLTGLITDQMSPRALGTDVNRAHNGGPVRKTMAAGVAWVDKRTGGNGRENTMTAAQQEAALKGLDATARIAQKYEWQSQGITLLND